MQSKSGGLKKKWQKVRFSLMKDGFKRAEYLRKHGVLRGIGENVYYYSRIFPADPQLLLLHNNISIATNVRFVCHDRIDILLTGMTGKHYRKYYGAIEVMDNVFIGADVIILPNVRIGPNAIVGAGAVVTKDVPPGTIVGGSPARVIGSFDKLMKKRAAHPKTPGSTERIWKRFERQHADINPEDDRQAVEDVKVMVNRSRRKAVRRRKKRRRRKRENKAAMEAANRLAALAEAEERMAGTGGTENGMNTFGEGTAVLPGASEQAAVLNKAGNTAPTGHTD